jgi:glycosyltransferase involved in cell wall biosynthesis
MIELANHAARNGSKVTVIAASPADPALQQSALDPRVEIRFVDPGGRGRGARYLKLVPWLLANRAWIASLDIVHCHLSWSAVFGSLVRLIGRRGGRRPAIVETYHAVGMPIPRFHRWLHARLAASRDALVLMAEEEYWRRFLRRRPRLVSALVPNGITFRPTRRRDSPAAAAYAREIGLPEGAGPILGTVGRIVPARHPEAYPPIFADVSEAIGGNASLILAGDGPVRPKVEQLVRELGLEDRVHFTGEALDPSLPMALIDLYLTINVGPITGVAALEAAAAGLPVIAIQLVEGYEARPEDWIWSSRDLSAVATRAIELLRDEPARRALAERQQAHVEAHHSVEVMARAYDRLYERALASL